MKSTANPLNRRNRILLAALVSQAGLLSALSACSTMKSIFAVDNPPVKNTPIANPFDERYSQENNRNENITLRSKKGDRSVEVEFPANSREVSDVVMPMSPSFKDGSRSPASTSSTDGNLVDERYLQKLPSISDREITGSLPRPQIEDEGKRREVENALGVMPTDQTSPNSDTSYLAAIDHLKQLYRSGRFEAALIESDDLLRSYPTDPKVYEMRGTLFDRIGKPELAMKSWNQSLRIEPNNPSLKKFVERKTLLQQQPKRGVASQ